MSVARLALAVSVLWCVCAASPASAGGRVAVVVGANVGVAGDARLRFAEADAERMASILRDVGGFDPADVILLGGTTADAVRRALISLNARLREERDGSLLFVYFSGHGDAESLHLSGTRLDLKELRYLVSGSSAQARVLVIDSCRSGGITRVKGGTPGPTFDVALHRSGPEGMAILTSSTAGEDSQESDLLRASIFTHYFASALLGAADRDRDGLVTLGESFAYSSERTLAASASTLAGPQHPTYRYDLGGRDDLVLTSPGRANAQVGFLSFSEPGMWLVSRASAVETVIAEVSTDAPGARLALREGSYVVTKRERDHLLQGPAAVAEGRTTGVSGGRMSRIDHARVVRKGGTDREAALSAFAVGGIRWPIFDLGTATRGDVGVRLDLPVLSLEARFGVGGSTALSDRLRIDTRELAASIAALRAFDLGPVTWSAGVEAGGVRIDQSFHEAQTPDRSAYGWSVGPLMTVQAPLAGPFDLRIEGSLLTWFLPGERDLQTPVSPRIAGGIGASF